MNILLVYPQYPDPYWSFKHALKFISQKASIIPLKKAMKFLIGFISAIFIMGVVSAQHGNVTAGHVTLGVKGGLNSTTFTMRTTPVTTREQGIILVCLAIFTATINGHFSQNWYIPPRVQKIITWAILMYLSCFNIFLTMDSGYRPAPRQVSLSVQTMILIIVPLLCRKILHDFSLP
jgi:hypothetical protein